MTGCSLRASCVCWRRRVAVLLTTCFPCCLAAFTSVVQSTVTVGQTGTVRLRFETSAGTLGAGGTVRFTFPANYQLGAVTLLASPLANFDSAATVVVNNVAKTVDLTLPGPAVTITGQVDVTLTHIANPSAPQLIGAGSIGVSILVGPGVTIATPSIATPAITGSELFFSSSGPANIVG
jgi:hypothetical protein